MQPHILPVIALLAVFLPWSAREIRRARKLNSHGRSFPDVFR